MNQKYIEILNNLLDEKIGENLFIAESNKDDTRIFVYLKYINGSRSSCAYIFTSNGYFRLSCLKNDYKFNSLEMFTELVNQIIENELKPKIIDAYKQKAITSLPIKMNLTIDKVNLPSITKEWIIRKFNDATFNESNCESMINPEIQLGKETLSINFSVDCGRNGIHKENTIYINDTGHINISLCEAIEGGGIESHLEKDIKEFLKIQQ